MPTDTAPSTTKPIVIDMPGAFDAWFSGTSIGQGATDLTDDLDKALQAAYQAATRTKRGKGYTLRLTFTDGAQPAAQVAATLWDYADFCLDANRDEPISSEVAAARTLRKRIEDVVPAAELRVKR